MNSHVYTVHASNRRVQKRCISSKMKGAGDIVESFASRELATIEPRT